MEEYPRERLDGVSNIIYETEALSNISSWLAATNAIDACISAVQSGIDTAQFIEEEEE